MFTPGRDQRCRGRHSTACRPQTTKRPTGRSEKRSAQKKAAPHPFGRELDLMGLSVEYGYGGDIDDAADIAAVLKHVNGLSHPHENGADGLGPAQFA